MLFICQGSFSSGNLGDYQRRRRDLNPRAAINDLLPFQGSPFSLLGTSPNQADYIFIYLFILQMPLTAYLLKYEDFIPEKKHPAEKYLQRRGWDSNPRALADKRFSRPPRYDHFDTSPCRTPFCQRNDYSSKSS